MERNVGEAAEIAASNPPAVAPATAPAKPVAPAALAPADKLKIPSLTVRTGITFG